MKLVLLIFGLIPIMLFTNHSGLAFKLANIWFFIFLAAVIWGIYYETKK